MRASKAQRLLRTDDMIQLVLNGNEWPQLRRIASEGAQNEASPWHTPSGIPVTRRTLERYRAVATEYIRRGLDEGRQQALDRHIAERRGLYRRAANAGDTRTALAILDSLARLQGLTPEGQLAEELRLAREEAAALPLHLGGGRQNGDGAHQAGPGGTQRPPGTNGNGTNGHGAHG